MNLKTFINTYEPTVQNNSKDFNKYLIPYECKASHIKLLCIHYNNKIFTGIRENDRLILQPGKSFHLDNCFHIITNKEIEDLDNHIIIEL